MQDFTKSQKGRLAIKAFRTIADAAALRGSYKPSTLSGQKMEEALKEISPEIYGSLNDPRSIEINGLKYILDRLPRGIETCTRIILTAKDEFNQTTFEKIEPPKRRRTSYRIDKDEICFIITRGWSEMYDILTHLTFLNIEAKKIYNRIKPQNKEISIEWERLEETIKTHNDIKGKTLDRALWNLSILLGTPYHETRKAYDDLEEMKQKYKSNAGLFKVIYKLGKRVEKELSSKENEMVVYFTPSFQNMIGHHRYSRNWAQGIKEKLREKEITNRPLHIISANMHSVVNLLYGYSALQRSTKKSKKEGLYDFILSVKEKTDEIKKYALKYGLTEMPDRSESHIDCQIIDTSKMKNLSFHPDLHIDTSVFKNKIPIILVIDYAFGFQAFDAMDELLNPDLEDAPTQMQNVESISIMGKAGTLPGKKGDIMLATAHVLEGQTHNYIVHNDLEPEDFNTLGHELDIYSGPMVTVLGTSLQNHDVLKRFKNSSWNAVGLEMEGGHYQRAINAAIIRGHISKNVKIRYAYYASDNPLTSGETLASGSMGNEGILPTYMITKVIIEKILC